MRIRTTMSLLAATTLLWAGAASAREISCDMTFDLAGWSAFYKTASGSGMVSCSNGAKMKVDIRTSI